MSEEQLLALLAKLKGDAGLQEKFKGAADLDAVVTIAKEAGFDVSMADWLRHQAKQILELTDEELDGVAGSFADTRGQLTICQMCISLESITQCLTSGFTDPCQQVNR
jgi:predicted ribosomally synthesized peptide with nif11-like leader